MRRSNWYDPSGADHVTRAIEAVQLFARGASCEKSIRRYQARLWTFGDAVGAACWRKGYDTCKARLAPVDGKVRLDLSTRELLQLTSIAHLGFRRMMPNDRGIETPRFNGEDHALAGSYAVEKLEQALPEELRPSNQGANRQALIRHWWPPQRKSA